VVWWTKISDDELRHDEVTSRVGCSSNFSRVYHESTKTKADKTTLFSPKARKDESAGKNLWRVSSADLWILLGRADNPDVVGQRGNTLVQDVI
jgi:hypothetical protein